MSDQSLFTSFQVHMTPGNNGTLVAIPSYVPSTFNRYVSVVSATIPVTYYNTVGAYLDFEYETVEDNLEAKHYYRFNIPDGQYSVQELCNICRISDVARDVHFFLEYDPFTGKLHMVMRSVDFVTNAFDYTTLYLKMLPTPFAAMLGFTQPGADGTFPLVQYTYPGMRVGGTHRNDLKMAVADNVVDLSGVRNVFIQTNFGILSEASNKVLAKIPIDVNFGGIVQYRNPNGFRGKIYSDDVISSVTVQLVDDHGNEINFNGVPWSVTLQFDFLKPDPEMFLFDAPDPDLQPETGVEEFPVQE